VGCNSHVHRSNTSILSVQLSLYQTSKNAGIFFVSYVFSSTELEKRTGQVLCGSEEV
jgi:hypothetical protein